MASLTETAYFARKAVNFSIIALIALIIIKVGFGFLYELWLALNPPPPPPPNVAFDVLPDINFPESTSSATFVYSLETIDGRFPFIPAIGKVYFIAIPRENLQSLNRAMEQASKLKFTGEPQTITTTIRQWTDPGNPLRTLRFDIATGNFLVKYDWANDPTIFNQKEVPDEVTAKTEAANFFQNMEILPKELENAKTQISYYKASVDQMVPASSLSSADFTRLDYLRDPIDNFPILGDTPTKTPLYIIYSGDRSEEKRMVEVSFVLWDIDKENYATYPLRPLEEAWTDLQKGKGYIANQGTSATNLISVRKIYLAYYYPTNPMNFLEPVYVFEGDKGFVAYVPAVKKDWLEKVLPLPNN